MNVWRWSIGALMGLVALPALDGYVINEILPRLPSPVDAALLGLMPLFDAMAILAVRSLIDLRRHGRTGRFAPGFLAAGAPLTLVLVLPALIDASILARYDEPVTFLFQDRLQGTAFQRWLATDESLAFAFEVGLLWVILAPLSLIAVLGGCVSRRLGIVVVSLNRVPKANENPSCAPTPA